MSDLRDLYQELILDHTKQPRNFGPLPSANRTADGVNPLCGDRITVSVEVDGDAVRDIHFEGSGCAISTASASLMTEALKGKPLREVEALFKNVHDLLTASEGDPCERGELGKLIVLSGVRDYPVRVKCAILAWHTLIAAIHRDRETVTTE
jgi:nitrogen fixation NifU-like protein